MRWLVTVHIHINNIQAIAWKPYTTTIENPLEAVFSIASVPSLCLELNAGWVYSFAGYSPKGNEVSIEAGETFLVNELPGND
jgi:hypothetical protein